MKTALALSFATAGLLAACATTGSGSAPTKSYMGMLTDPAGMTLYVYDKDPAGAGKSLCNGPCGQNWPPLAAGMNDQATGDYTVIKRDDGSQQWAYKGQPLYRWIKDQKQGDATGDGFKDVWHVARP